MSDRTAYHLVQGTPRRVYGARNHILRESHALAVVATEGETAKDKPQAMWAKDLRRERRNIYGSLLRFIDLLHRRGFPLETALMIPRWLEEFIRDTWSDRPTQTALDSCKDRAA